MLHWQLTVGNRSSKDHRARELLRQIGQQIAPDPDPPEYDPITGYILTVYNTVTRARRYVETQPLPLSMSDIKAYYDTHTVPSLISKELLQRVIIDLDDTLLDHLRDMRK